MATGHTVDNDFFTQELRLSSSQGDGFDYLVGLYYSDSETDQRGARNYTVIVAANVGNKTKAVFGEFSWNVGDDNNA